MRKIPTIFVRDMSRQPALVTAEVTPGCLWVFQGEGVPTQKYDGTCCLVRDGRLYKRYELRPGKPAPHDFEPAQEPDPNTGKQPGWVPVGEGPDDKWHREAFAERQTWADGTYELVGQKVQGNPYRASTHWLMPHASMPQLPEPEGGRYYDGIKALLTEKHIEGIVWHHPDGRMAKIKRRDFGLPWPVKGED